MILGPPTPDEIEMVDMTYRGILIRMERSLEPFPLESETLRQKHVMELADTYEALGCFPDTPRLELVAMADKALPA